MYGLECVYLTPESLPCYFSWLLRSTLQNSVRFRRGKKFWVLPQISRGNNPFGTNCPVGIHAVPFLFYFSDINWNVPREVPGGNDGITPMSPLSRFSDRLTSHGFPLRLTFSGPLNIPRPRQIFPFACLQKKEKEDLPKSSTPVLSLFQVSILLPCPRKTSPPTAAVTAIV